MSRLPDTGGLIADTLSCAPPPGRLLLKEGAGLLLRVWRSFGKVGERGPVQGVPVFVIPGFLASDRTTLGLQRALAAAGYRVTGWGLGLNRGVRAGLLEEVADRLSAFANGRPTILIGWSLGGIYAREVAKLRPDLVARVVTLGAPFSGSPRGNNVWRLYERIAGHPVDAPPVAVQLAVKPPVRTIALWSRRDGIVAPACACGQQAESDRQIELQCSHMGFAVDGKAYPAIIEALRD